MTAGMAACAVAAERDARCAVIDVFQRTDDPTAPDIVQTVERFAAGRTGVVVVSRFVDTVPDDRAALGRLAARHGLPPDALPVVQAGGVAIAGAGDRLAERLQSALRIEVFVRAGCARCARAKEWLPVLEAAYPGFEIVVSDVLADAGARELLAQLAREQRTPAASFPTFHLCGRLIVGFDRPDSMLPRFERLLAPWTRACRVAVGAPADAADEGLAADESVDLPWLGRVDPDRLGMPLFTLAIGLVDGFNPCAMWVLLLLLSILVNLADRWRILAIAGTFVAVSGAAYFAFMAAWLNVFEWIGMLRPVQVTLGLLAVGVGVVHVKDSFAFGRGPSLSIPDSAKPGIYARIRRIVNAENLPAAVAGAFVLAVLVNLVELLCTAGLPALYTGVLAQRGYSTAARYGYLGLYIAAYMFDDALMVAAVTASLRRWKLQETGGRWLKLLSGGVILALGLTMLLRPEWLEG